MAAVSIRIDAWVDSDSPGLRSFDDLDEDVRQAVTKGLEDEGITATDVRVTVEAVR